MYRAKAATGKDRPSATECPLWSWRLVQPQPFPLKVKERPVRIVVGFAADGATDIQGIKVE